MFDIEFSSLCFNVPQMCNFTSGGVPYHEIKNGRLGMIVMSFQDFKLHSKQVSQAFSYFLINNTLLYQLLANLLAHNKSIRSLDFMFFTF